MKDKLLGPADTTGRTQYQVLCPMFDTTTVIPGIVSDSPGEGNFIGAPLEERPAVTIDGKIWVLNVTKIPNYFLAKDYGFQPIDYEKNNWERLKAIAAIEMPGLNEMQLLNSLAIQVNLAQPSGTRTNARIYLVQVSMTRSQITPSVGKDGAQGSSAFPVFPTPGLLASRELFFPLIQGVMTTKDTVEARTKAK